MILLNKKTEKTKIKLKVNLSSVTIDEERQARVATLHHPAVLQHVLGWLGARTVILQLAHQLVTASYILHYNMCTFVLNGL